MVYGTYSEQVTGVYTPTSHWGGPVISMLDAILNALLSEVHFFLNIFSGILGITSLDKVRQKVKINVNKWSAICSV